MFASKIANWCTTGVAAALVSSIVALSVAVAAPDPERIEERLPSKIQRPDAPDTTRPQTTAQDLSGFPPFTLNGVRVEGATVFSSEQVENCYHGLIGRTVDANDMAKLAQCVTQLYRDDGFFLSRAVIPSQEVEGGVLTVKIIEGYIVSVSAAGMSDQEATAQFASALEERPARLQTFERALLLLADRPGYRVAASQLVPVPDDPARFIYQLKVARQPLSYRIFADNRGTEAQGPDQVYGSIAWNSVFGDSDRITGALFTAPSSTRELLYADLNYLSGWMGGVFWTEFDASTTRSEDGAVLKAFAVRSETQRFYMRLGSPLIRTRAETLWANLTFDARDVEEATILGADEATRVIRANAIWTTTDGESRNDLTVELSHGFDAFGSSENGDPRMTRFDGRPQFTKLRLDAAHLRRFSQQWELMLTAAAQIADGALVSSEEFGAGGARFGRAYDYSEVTGDHGAAAGVELRFNIRSLFDATSSAQLYGFADVAWVWNVGRDPTAPDEADLSSTGLGVRVTPFPAVSASLEVAKPLSRDVAEQGDRNPRVFVSLSAAW